MAKILEGAKQKVVDFGARAWENTQKLFNDPVAYFEETNETTWKPLVKSVVGDDENSFAYKAFKYVGTRWEASVSNTINLPKNMVFGTWGIVDNYLIKPN